MSGPEYDLNDVKAAARRLNIEYRGRIVQRDINNLGYELTDVARCVIRLSVDDYRHSIRYEDRPTDDVYMCTFTRAGNEGLCSDDLYIKFCLVDQYLSIDLGSFHLRRF